MQMFDIPHFYQWLHFTKLDPAVELLQILMCSQGQSIPSAFDLEKKFVSSLLTKKHAVEKLFIFVLYDHLTFPTHA